MNIANLRGPHHIVPLMVVAGMAALPITLRAAESVASPNGNVVLTVDDASGKPTYTVTFAGSTVVEPSALGVTLNGVDLASGTVLSGISNYSGNETFESRHGIHAVGTNQYNGRVITLRHSASGTEFFLNVRVYNDGAAFRYEFTGQDVKAITAELSSFVLPVGSGVWSQDGTSVYEGVYGRADIAAIAVDAIMGPPLTVELPHGKGFLALTESVPGVFGSPYLQKTGAGRELRVRYPVNQAGGTGASVTGAVNTPWNVVMVAADLNGLVNNDIVESLAPAPDPSLFPEGPATAWARPGRSVWDWLRPQPGGITHTNAMTNSLWAARMGFEYNTIDEGWANWNNRNPWPQVKQVVDYSHALGVKVLVWKRSAELSSQSQRNAFFTQLKAYGVDGFKADFFDFGSVSASARERVQLQEQILREAAVHRLVVNFHGCTKPTGQFQTWPNLLNVEAVFGKEQWLSSVAAMPVPFTRFLAGPADFTPMEFGGNKAYEIATVINMPGPLLTYAERSDTMAKSPFASVIRAIPCMWDETIVLPQSTLGTTVATARRSGDEWFLGIMNTAVPQNWTVPLSFLDAGKTYRVQIIREGSNAIERSTATKFSTVSVNIARTGASGFVARFYTEPALGMSTNRLLKGSVIGTSGSWVNSGNTKEKAFDGELSTFFDAPTTSGAWTGLDLGSQRLVTAIRYCPRANWPGRMVDGVFEGANNPDFSDAVTLHVVGFTPSEAEFTTVTITNRSLFRYLRYVSPPNGSCNVSEIEFYGPATTQPRLRAARVAPSLIGLSWPEEHTGWRLQTAANGFQSRWLDVPNATETNDVLVAMEQPERFFRLIFP